MVRTTLVVTTALLVMVGTAVSATAAGTPAPGAMTWTDPATTSVDLAVDTGHARLQVHVRPGTAGDGRLAVAAAHAAGRGVELAALAGDPTWADTHRHHLLAWIDEVVGTGLVDELVLDVEPYLLPAWHDPTTHAALVARFAGTLELARVHAGGTTLTVAVPFWFDEIAADGGPTLLDVVARHADHLLVMAYRDSAAGVLALLDDERRVAAATGTGLEVALELTPQEPAYVSFHGQDQGRIDAARATIDAALVGDPTYRGTTVHTLEAYASAPPAPAPGRGNGGGKGPKR
jgi:hypothetical protein